MTTIKLVPIDYSLVVPYLRQSLEGHSLAVEDLQSGRWYALAPLSRGPIQLANLRNGGLLPTNVVDSQGRLVVHRVRSTIFNLAEFLIWASKSVGNLIAVALEAFTGAFEDVPHCALTEGVLPVSHLAILPTSDVYELASAIDNRRESWHFLMYCDALRDYMIDDNPKWPGNMLVCGAFDGESFLIWISELWISRVNPSTYSSRLIEPIDTKGPDQLRGTV